jgi:FdrA protein
MTVRGVVRPSVYLDSVVLLELARVLRAEPGVREAAALMGTPANHEMLQAAGLGAAGTLAAGPGDLMLVVAAETDVRAGAALDAADAWLAGRRDGAGGKGGAPNDAGGEAGGPRPRSLDSALRRLPTASLCVVSVPGAYAAREARKALRRGLHVFLFSDHVSLEDEVRLKDLAGRRGLLCMGPDCGTAYLGGVGLGFANAVPRGRVGIVAASGTGLQAVAAHLAALGEGVSHGIGVGGRDLSAAVGGRMTRAALGALALDPATAAVVLVTKPPDPAVLPLLGAALATLGKPVVVCVLGLPDHGGPGHVVETLEEAALAVVALLRGERRARRPFTDTSRVREHLGTLAADGGRRGPAILGLYTGGTLAAEARMILAPLVGPVAVGDLPEPSPRHRVIDLGDDAYTAGRPHPMLDPEGRDTRVRAAGHDPTIGVVLLDLVLGHGTHPDPASSLAPAIREARNAARAAGRSLAVVGAIVGTEGDPQGLGRQAAALAAAGAVLLPSNAQAARLAALLVRPDLAATWLEATETLPAPVAPLAAGRESSGPRPSAARPEPLTRLLGGPLGVINVGLEAFARVMARSGLPVVHVDWRPPADGDPRLARLLERLDDDAEADAEEARG